MISTTQLQTKIIVDIIGPSLTTETVKDKGLELGFGKELSKEDYAKLYNTLFKETLDRVSDFMKSDEAKNLCKDVHLFSVRGSFSSIVRERLKPIIKDTFAIKEPPITIGAWLWSLIPSWSSEKNL